MSRIEEIMKIEGFKKLTPIQEAVVNRKDPNRDLVGISSTGSGKSHAFFMPLFERIDPEKDEVQA
ncbi:DEAD/DEAH box helicase, partial [uncultured Faecalibaculum sp.]